MLYIDEMVRVLCIGWMEVEAWTEGLELWCCASSDEGMGTEGAIRDVKGEGTEARLTIDEGVVGCERGERSCA